MAGQTEVGLFGTANDQPRVELNSSDRILLRSDSYQMHFMAQPDLPGSIPVPISVIPWKWSGLVTNYIFVENAIIVSSTQPTNTGSFINGTPTVSYPFWTNNIKNTITTP